jgi:hypothetical protein
VEVEVSVRRIEDRAKFTSLVPVASALGSMIFRPEASRMHYCLCEWEFMRFVCSGGELCGRGGSRGCLIASFSLDVPSYWLYFRPKVTHEKLDVVFLVYREMLYLIEDEW